MDDQHQFPGFFSYIVKSLLFVVETRMPGETQGSAQVIGESYQIQLYRIHLITSTDLTICLILYCMSVYGLPVLTEIISVVT